jgi:hypothetical protein
MDDKLMTMTVADILALPDAKTKRQWGNWLLETSDWTLVYIEPNGRSWPTYEIDLEEINTCGARLDWIFQLKHKTWMST